MQGRKWRKTGKRLEQKEWDAACMGCSLGLTAVVENDIIPESILWDRCPECGDHLVTLTLIKSD